MSMCSVSHAGTIPCVNSSFSASTLVAGKNSRFPKVCFHCTSSTRGGFSLQCASKGCAKCKNKGAVECEGCKGTGKNKKNGNMFERWKCYDCQGFGLMGCKNCGTGGLTPEQRGER
ncbi:unnamed protein product [Sphagnum compactum]